VLGLADRISRLSALGLPPVDRTTIVPELCRHFGADTFLLGPHAADYLDFDELRRQGIRPEVFVYDHPRYRQQYPGFVSHLSVLDLILNCGPQAADIVKGGSA